MRLILVFVLAAFGVVSVASSDEPDTPSRVLLLSGQNNHNWQKTTPKIKSLLETTGRFKVDIHERPDQLTAEILQPYGVIVSNWNSYGKGDDRITAWPEATKKAYIDYARSGGGHVVVHAGSSSFPNWDEYLQLTLATWKLGQTGHGPKHEFTVQIDSVDHAITRGMADFKIHDELWHRSQVQGGATVLASAFSTKEHRGSGQSEPIAMINQFGQGRSFTLLLGHGVDQMENPGFAALLVRGTQWAATGQVTVDAPATH